MSPRDAANSGLEVVDDPRGGFVLALVVLLLFGIGVAGAAGYQVVFNEALLSVHAKETQTALSIARAGLRAYIGKQIGVHDDTVTYSIAGGDAVITARLVSEIDDFETLYLLGSQGVYTDPTFTGSAARRTVYQYAIKREVALNHVAMLTLVTGTLYVEDEAHIDGNEEAGVGCPQASVDITALLMGTPPGSVTIESGDPIDGPNPEIRYAGSEAAALDSIGIDWAVLSSPDFPVDYEDTWASCALPVDSFTVTRFNGNLSSSPPVQSPGRPDCDGELYRGRRTPVGRHSARRPHRYYHQQLQDRRAGRGWPGRQRDLHQVGRQHPHRLPSLLRLRSGQTLEPLQAGRQYLVGGDVGPPGCLPRARAGSKLRPCPRSCR